MNYNGLSEILWEKCANKANDCQPNVSIDAPEQKNNIAGRISFFP